ncbi:MAG: hypothetical protein J5I65_12870 [Aridibacter famidurans]|nr:hypothetical protein [Aridibacter famidurans]
MSTNKTVLGGDPGKDPREQFIQFIPFALLVSRKGTAEDIRRDISAG